MTKTRNTKRALLASALALLVCVSMLIGSTFAWFTDSVTSAIVPALKSIISAPRPFGKVTSPRDSLIFLILLINITAPTTVIPMTAIL